MLYLCVDKTLPLQKFSDFPTVSVARAGILYAHVGLPRGEDVGEGELVPDGIDAVDGHDDLPVSAVLGLEVVELEPTLGRTVAAASDRVVLESVGQVSTFNFCHKLFAYCVLKILNQS